MHGYTHKTKAFHLAFSMFQWWLMNNCYDASFVMGVWAKMSLKLSRLNSTLKPTPIQRCYPTQKELFGSFPKTKGSWKTETPILMVELVCVFYGSVPVQSSLGV